MSERDDFAAKKDTMSRKLDRVSIRMVKEPPLLSPVPMNSPEAAIRVMADFMKDMDRELFCVVSLKSNLQPINMNVVSIGTLNEACVHPREILKPVLLSQIENNSGSMMLFHFHPSGSLEPSREDIAITDRMQKAGALLGIPVLDHIICSTGNEYYSFHERGTLPLPEYSFAKSVDAINLPGTGRRVAEVADNSYPVAQKSEPVAKIGEQVAKTSESVTRKSFSADKKKDTMSTKEQVKEITDKLQGELEKLFDSDRYKSFLRSMSAFHSYSFNNTLLIFSQMPNAQGPIGSFTTWKKVGRYVERGQKGLTILAPAPYKKEKERDIIDKATGQPKLGPDGKPMKEKVEVTIPAFKPVKVFDYSQTGGKELPSLGVHELQGNVKGYENFIEALHRISPVPIVEEEIKGEAKGYFSRAEGKIAIQKGMSQLQSIKTLLHEICHSMRDNEAMIEREKKGEIPQKDRQTREVIAESVAYTCSTRFNIRSDAGDVSDYSFGYIAGWSSGRDMKELKGYMEEIRKTSSEMIKGIEAELQEIELAQEKELLTEAMKAAEYELDPINSSDEVPVFIYTGAVASPDRTMQFENGWGEVRDWLEGVVFDDPEISDRVERVLHPEHFIEEQPSLQIYQLKHNEQTEELLFEDMHWLEKKGLTVDVDNYDLVYSGERRAGETLDDIYERFNIDHPDDFTGHSLSVSDVVVLSQGGEQKAYYVDSIGFQELSGFVREHPVTMEEVIEAVEQPQELAVAIEDRYVSIQMTDGGYDYSVYDQNFRLLDGGVLDNDSISIDSALKEIVSDLEGNIRGGIQAESEMRVMDYERLMDQVDEVENTEITYIVSECNEFPGLGEYHTDIPTVQEAVKAYEAIDPKRMNGIPSVAMNVHTKGKDPVEDMQIDLVVGKRIDADILRYVPDIKDNPKVQDSLTELISYFPDYPVEGKEQIHQMPAAYQRDSAGTLAQAVDQFMYGIDPKAYEAGGVSREGNIQRITDEIRQGQAGYLKEYLQEIVYDTGCSHDLQVDARNLMQRMSKYEQENPIAHIEELEEDNLNMVDGIRNNTSPKDREEAKKDTVSRNEPEQKAFGKKEAPARASLKERLKQKQSLIGSDGGAQGKAQQREVQ